VDGEDRALFENQIMKVNMVMEEKLYTCCTLELDGLNNHLHTLSASPPGKETQNHTGDKAGSSPELVWIQW
jgi:hypothetical protein